MLHGMGDFTQWQCLQARPLRATASRRAPTAAGSSRPTPPSPTRPDQNGDRQEHDEPLVAGEKRQLLGRAVRGGLECGNQEQNRKCTCQDANHGRADVRSSSDTGDAGWPLIRGLRLERHPQAGSQNDDEQSRGYTSRQDPRETFDAPAGQEGEILKLCGWRTRSMFDRYNFIDEANLAAAVAKRFGNAKQRQTSRLARSP